MLSLHSGIERTERQWIVIALLESVGLQAVKFWNMDRGEGLVEAALKE